MEELWSRSQIPEIIADLRSLHVPEFHDMKERYRKNRLRGDHHERERLDNGSQKESCTGPLNGSRYPEYRALLRDVESGRN